MTAITPIARTVEIIEEATRFNCRLSFLYAPVICRLAFANRSIAMMSGNRVSSRQGKGKTSDSEKRWFEVVNKSIVYSLQNISSVFTIHFLFTNEDINL